MPDGSTVTLTRTTPDTGGAWKYAHTENGTNWGSSSLTRRATRL